MRRGPAQLIEITGRYTWKPFPNAAWNAKPGSGPNVLNTAHGVAIDSKDRLWVIDHGNWMTTRHRSSLPSTSIPQARFPPRLSRIDGSEGGIMQDLAVDGERGLLTLPIAAADPRSSWLTQIRTISAI